MRNMGKSRGFKRRALALLMTLCMVSGLIPGIPAGTVEVQAADPVFTLSEFHLTDSSWTNDPETGIFTGIDRQPSVSMKWSTTGLPETGENEWYDAELFVAPYNIDIAKSIGSTILLVSFFCHSVDEQACCK